MINQRTKVEQKSNIRISIIAAIGKNRELGKNNRLLWHIPSDLKRFKLITYGYPIIMGRKTYESIGKPLPGRNNIVITRNIGYQPVGVVVVHSLQEALEVAGSDGNKEVFIIGGAEIFKQAMPITDRLYLTVVDATADADVYFPDYSQFSKIIEMKKGKYITLSFTYYTMEKQLYKKRQKIL